MKTITAPRIRSMEWILAGASNLPVDCAAAVAVTRFAMSNLPDPVVSQNTEKMSAVRRVENQVVRNGGVVQLGLFGEKRAHSDSSRSRSHRRSSYRGRLIRLRAIPSMVHSQMISTATNMG